MLRWIVKAGLLPRRLVLTLALGPLGLVLRRRGVDGTLRGRGLLRSERLDELALGARQRFQTVTLLRVLEAGPNQTHLLKELSVDLAARFLGSERVLVLIVQVRQDLEVVELLFAYFRRQILIQAASTAGLASLDPLRN